MSIIVNNYICYNVLLRSTEEINLNLFKTNREIMRNQGNTVPHCWRETSSVSRFFLIDLISNKLMDKSSNFNFKALDSEGN